VNKVRKGLVAGVVLAASTMATLATEGVPDPTLIYSGASTIFNAAAVIGIAALVVLTGVRFAKKGLRAS